MWFINWCCYWLCCLWLTLLLDHAAGLCSWGVPLSINEYLGPWHKFLTDVIYLDRHCLWKCSLFVLCSPARGSCFLMVPKVVLLSGNDSLTTATSKTQKQQQQKKISTRRHFSLQQNWLSLHRKQMRNIDIAIGKGQAFEHK